MKYGRIRVFGAGTSRALRALVIGISESLLTFVDGAGGVLSFVEFRLPCECRILDSLVGTLSALGVQILHIQVQRHRDHVNHRVRVAECDGSDVASPRRFEVQHALSDLVARELESVRRPLAKSRLSVPVVAGSSAGRP
jgi:hypothetical protein